MFTRQLTLENVRTFVKATLEFVHPDSDYASKGQQRKGLYPIKQMASGTEVEG